MRSRAGLSLVEVMVALVVFAAGVLPVIFGVGLAVREGRRGQARALVAVALLSRMAVLRHTALATDPRCAALAPGDSAGRIREEWSVERRGDQALILIRGSMQQPGGPVADSLRLLIRCG